MQLRRVLALAIVASGGALGAVAGVATAGCGSRSPLAPGPPRPADAGRYCLADADCPGFADKCKPVHCDAIGNYCLGDAPIVCDDGDACTNDVCDSDTGTCSFPPKSFDLDGDGHKGPIPGVLPGAPGSCGDDCNDTSAAAFPGGVEVCDGVDNDCNGVVDDGAEYAPRAGVDPVRVSTNVADFALPGALAFQDKGFFATWNGDQAGKDRLFRSLLDLDGTAQIPEARVTQVEADNGGGVVAWTGDRYGVVWDDRRAGNYDLFFALFDRHGQKMAPGDVRLTDTLGFSINESVVWTGAEFAAVWQDGEGDNGTFSVRGQRISLDAAPAGAAVEIASAGESPVIAVGRPGLGVAWAQGSASSHQIWFMPTDLSLSPAGPPVRVSAPGAVDPVYPTIVWNQDVFVVAWYERSASGASVWAAALDGKGAVVVPAKQVTQSPRFTRDPALLPLGDRLIMVYADTRDQNQGYELYTRTLGHDLTPIGDAARITTSPGDSVSPTIAFGPATGGGADAGPSAGPLGNIGVLFRDDKTGKPQAYFTHLACQAK